ncbi:hypothetical protein BC332_31669 [Capsicum chinense]|nr:hypothetical protein BC332_31669 [Capsicum chinense]
MGGVGEFGISWNRDFSILRKEEDLEISQPNRNATLGVNNYSRPDVVLTGHQDNVEFALAMGDFEPFVLSGGRPTRH